MNVSPPKKTAYVLKRYPRFSETFIVNEILAHEAAGRELEIFSLGPCLDTHFQNAISLVRAPVSYLPAEAPKSADFWRALQDAAAAAGGSAALDAVRGEEVREVHQALVLAAAARQRGIGHLHAHFATSAVTVARLAARLAGLPYSFTAHAKDIFHENVSPEELRVKLRDAAAVITVSDFNARHLREHFGDDAGNVTRLYNGLDLAQFPFLEPAVRPPRIIAVGRLVEKKGFDVLVDACAELGRRGVTFTCAIAGTGECEAALRAQIVTRNLSGHVELLGPRPQRDIIALVQGAAALAAPCEVGNDGDRDGLPTVLLEAMALGTPCVATDVTGIPEVVRPNDTGLLVSQRDAVALAGALQRLLADAGMRVRLARAARRLIETEFDITRNAARLRAIFDALPRPHEPEYPLTPSLSPVRSGSVLNEPRGLHLRR
jgi:glycosyltransferase involved in cell wall biosynthesis